MTKYYVEIPVIGTAKYEVEADDSGQAIDIVREGELDWLALTSLYQDANAVCSVSFAVDTEKN